jgi:hypothetical protein
MIFTFSNKRIYSLLMVLTIPIAGCTSQKSNALSYKEKLSAAQAASGDTADAAPSDSENESACLKAYKLKVEQAKVAKLALADEEEEASETDEGTDDTSVDEAESDPCAVPDESVPDEEPTEEETALRGKIKK